ncbi:D-alanyl-D-alanine carboxypeptidase family protein [Actinomadura coerulea]|uniref:D-alanyl-D-alanine carboxypeptidase family protein n=1 Tax=Actinomadura coerulea TaxID=46159 RepID=UPI0034349DC0
MGDDAELDAEPARNRTAEFRVPVKVNLTRPDIAIRRPAEPRDEPGDDAADEPAAEPVAEVLDETVDDTEAETSDEAVDDTSGGTGDTGDEAAEKPAGSNWYVQFTPPPQEEEPAREAPSRAAPPPPETEPWRPTSPSVEDEEPAQEDDTASPVEEPPAEERPEDDPAQTDPPQRDHASAAAPPEPQERTDDARDAREARSTSAPRPASSPEPDDAPPPAATPRSSGRHAIRPPAEHPQAAAPEPEAQQEPPSAAPPTRGRRHAPPPDAETPQRPAPHAAPAPSQHREHPGDVQQPRGRRARPAPPGTERPQGAAPRTAPAQPHHQERPGDVRETRGDRALPAPPRQSAPPEAERPQGAAAPAMWPEAPGDVRGAAPSPAGPTRVEWLPDLSAQDGPWEASLPAPAAPTARTSGQWSVPWDGAAPPAQPSRPAQPAQPAQPAYPAGPVEVEKRKGKRRWLVVVAAMLVLIAGVVAGQLLRPPPDPTVRLTIASSHTFPGQAPALPWPGVGQAVLYVDGVGTMGSSGGAVPTPTASVAKVMTAYVYLNEHPLKSGEAGPVLTVSPQAAAQIPARKRRGESLLEVTANQRLTQRKALEALLIISANDVAHELARWDSGSDQAFVAKMNAAAQRLGMTATRYTDPSGYHSGTVSTAADQVKLLRAAMRNPVFAEIVNNRMYVPDGGGSPRQGGNFILGRNGVVGGKTGYTDAAGGNFVFAARRDVGGTQTLIVGAVMGQRSPSAADAVNTAEGILVAAEQAMVAAPLARPGQTVAWIDDGLGGRKALTAASPVNVVGWPGLTVPVRFDGDPPAEAERGTRAGVVDAGAARIPLKVGTGRPPSMVKRLTRLS